MKELFVLFLIVVPLCWFPICVYSWANCNTPPENACEVQKWLIFYPEISGEVKEYLKDNRLTNAEYSNLKIEVNRIKSHEVIKQMQEDLKEPKK